VTGEFAREGELSECCLHAAAMLQVHLLALHEEECDSPGAAGAAAARFGFAFLDAAAGRYYVGEVLDDAGRANLSALLVQARPLRAAARPQRVGSLVLRTASGASYHVGLYGMRSSHVLSSIAAWQSHQVGPGANTPGRAGPSFRACLGYSNT